jgi:hypothetical protein
MNRKELIEITTIKNEIVAEKLIEEKKFNEAEMLLERNVKLKSNSYKTYDLLLKIFMGKNSYNDIIRVLNIAIKNSPDKAKVCRELRKVTILNELVKNIYQV